MRITVQTRDFQISSPNTPRKLITKRVNASKDLQWREAVTKTVEILL